ncbi:MAG: wax ester/triacylglycerol synthase domain-containing protein, partial [Sporichthyaceae bacterium]
PASQGSPRHCGNRVPGVAGVFLVAAHPPGAGAVSGPRRRLRSEWFPVVGATWAQDPGFDARAHVHLHRSRGAGGAEEVQAWVARLLMEPLDRARPLWQVHVLTGLAGGGHALLLKTHHAFLDGQGTAAVAYALSDGGDPGRVPGPGPGAGSGTIPAARAAAGRMLGPLTPLRDPPRAIRGAARALSSLTGVASALREPGAGLPIDTVVGHQRAFVSATLDLADLRRVRALCGASVNDVAIAVISGGLRRWLAAHHYDVDTLSLRALVPTGSGRAYVGGSGNNFSAYLVKLPVDEPDAMARVRKVGAAMTLHRTSGPHGGPGALADLTNLLPPAAVRLGGPLLAAHASRLFDVLVTTVPVPRPLSFAGAPVRELYPLTPLGPGQPLAIGAACYQGLFHVGITVDPVVVPSPAGLARAMSQDLADLVAMGPSATLERIAVG